MPEGGNSWSERGGDDEKPRWVERKSFWKEKLFNLMQRDKSGNTWKSWKDHSWVRRPENEQKPEWSEHSSVKRWTMEKPEKPGWEKKPTTVNLQTQRWKEHSWVKRPTTEEETPSSWKHHSWVKRPTTVNEEKPKWAEHSWVKKPATGEKESWKEDMWAKRQGRGAEGKHTTWTARQNNCDNELSAKFSAMVTKMDEMSKNFKTSLNKFYKKVEALLDQMTIKNGTPVDQDGNQMRKGAKL